MIDVKGGGRDNRQGADDDEPFPFSENLKVIGESHLIARIGVMIGFVPWRMTVFADFH